MAPLVYPAEPVSRPEGCCLQGGGAGSRDGASASITNTWEGAELLFARNSTPAPTSQTAAAECDALDPELRCCLQDCADAVSDPRNFCCWRFQVNRFRDVALAVTRPVIRMAGSCHFRGLFAANLAVLRIGGNLVSVVFGSTLSLACQFAADQLARLKLGKLKGFLAIAAAPFRHTAVVASPAWGNRRRPSATEQI